VADDSWERQIAVYRDLELWFGLLSLVNYDPSPAVWSGPFLCENQSERCNTRCVYMHPSVEN
jgi:hypothetical protein